MTIMPNANPTMVLLARESRAFTQQDLAKQIGVSQGTLSKIEAGQLSPTADQLASLADCLNYPARFFLQECSAMELPPSFYRKRVSASAKAIRQIRARINILRLQILTLLQSVDIPEWGVPSVSLEEYGGGPEDVAVGMRGFWSLPRGPVANLTRILENAGVVVARCDFGPHKLDAISMYGRGGTSPPMIFVNQSIPGDRLRFSLTHELGHIVMHHNLLFPGAEIEDEANRFAAEFLMPAADIRPHLATPTIERLANLKQHWRVSIASLLTRASDLRQATPARARQLWIELARAGYKTKEPLPLSIEEPTLVQEIVQTHKARLGYTEADMANLVSLNRDDYFTQFELSRQSLRVVRTK